MDDDQLIDEALAGNSGSFGHLVERYQDRLFHAVAHMSGSVDDARDVVQDAFVQAFVKLESFHRASAFYTWLYRIALNTALDRRRRRRHVGSIDRAREDFGNEPSDRGDLPHERLEGQERAEQVRSALAALADDHRVVLVLREMDGQSYEQIAAILDLPVGTVRSRLHRARQQMRELLKQSLQIEHE